MDTQKAMFARRLGYTIQYNTIQYNTNFIVNSSWGIFIENNNRNNLKKEKKYLKIIDKRYYYLKKLFFLHVKLTTLKTDLKGRLSFYV